MEDDAAGRPPLRLLPPFCLGALAWTSGIAICAHGGLRAGATAQTCASWRLAKGAVEEKLAWNTQASPISARRTQGCQQRIHAHECSTKVWYAYGSWTTPDSAYVLPGTKRTENQAPPLSATKQKRPVALLDEGLAQRAAASPPMQTNYSKACLQPPNICHTHGPICQKSKSPNVQSPAQQLVVPLLGRARALNGKGCSHAVTAAAKTAAAAAAAAAAVSTTEQLCAAGLVTVMVAGAVLAVGAVTVVKAATLAGAVMVDGAVKVARAALYDLTPRTYGGLGWGRRTLVVATAQGESWAGVIAGATA
eukprot:scaffold127103_cov17-Tisochrysis_lutea.AAC.5